MSEFGGVVTGTFQNQTVQRAGAIFRAGGPPGKWVGVNGNVYFDSTNLLLYRKWANVWGAFVFTLPAQPATVVAGLKWYGDTPPPPSLGNNGDYYILWGDGQRGVYPKLYGPKANSGWPETGIGTLRPYTLASFTPSGLLDDGAQTTALPTTMILAGVNAESSGFQDNTTSDILPVGVSQEASEVTWVLNPSYTG